MSAYAVDLSRLTFPSGRRENSDLGRCPYQQKNELVKKNLEFNFWTIGTIASRSYQHFLEREMKVYHPSLIALGMAK